MVFPEWWLGNGLPSGRHMLQGCLPEYALAHAAGAEVLLTLADVGGQGVDDLRLGHRAQRYIAFEAQGERLNASGEGEAGGDFDQLRRRLQRMHITAVGNAAPLEQCAVASQYDAAVAAGQALDLGIVEMVVVDRVEAGHAQQAGQAAEMASAMKRVTRRGGGAGGAGGRCRGFRTSDRRKPGRPLAGADSKPTETRSPGSARLGVRHPGHLVTC